MPPPTKLSRLSNLSCSIDRWLMAVQRRFASTAASWPLMSLPPTSMQVIDLPAYAAASTCLLAHSPVPFASVCACAVFRRPARMDGWMQWPLQWQSVLKQFVQDHDSVPSESPTSVFSSCCLSTPCLFISLAISLSPLPSRADNSASLAEALRQVMASRAGQDNFQLIVITHDEKFARQIGTNVSGQLVRAI